MRTPALQIVIQPKKRKNTHNINHHFDEENDSRTTHERENTKIKQGQNSLKNTENDSKL